MGETKLLPPMFGLSDILSVWEAVSVLTSSPWGQMRDQ